MKSFKIFARSFFITSVIIGCVFLGFFGICRAYEKMRLIGFGEYRSALEIENEKVKIFDFEIDIK